jgi:hypothetical protein
MIPPPKQIERARGVRKEVVPYDPGGALLYGFCRAHSAPTGRQFHFRIHPRRYGHPIAALPSDRKLSAGWLEHGTAFGGHPSAACFIGVGKDARSGDQPRGSRCSNSSHFGEARNASLKRGARRSKTFQCFAAATTKGHLETRFQAARNLIGQSGQPEVISIQAEGKGRKSVRSGESRWMRGAPAASCPRARKSEDIGHWNESAADAGRDNNTVVAEVSGQEKVSTDGKARIFSTLGGTGACVTSPNAAPSSNALREPERRPAAYFGSSYRCRYRGTSNRGAIAPRRGSGTS